MAAVTKSRWLAAQEAELSFWRDMEFYELVKSCAEKLEFWSVLDAGTIKPLLDAKDVLEIGCGPLGISVVSLSGLGDQVRRLVKIDPLPQLSLPETNPGRQIWATPFLAWVTQVARHGEYVHVAGEELPFDSAFDTVVTYNVLDHVRSPVAILQKAYGALRPGGFLLVGVDCLSWLGQARFEWLTRRTARGSILVEAHPHTFRPSQVACMIRGAGFRLAEIRALPSRLRQFMGRHFRPVFVAQKISSR